MKPAQGYNNNKIITKSLSTMEAKKGESQFNI